MWGGEEKARRGSCDCDCDSVGGGIVMSNGDVFVFFCFFALHPLLSSRRYAQGGMRCPLSSSRQGQAPRQPHRQGRWCALWPMRLAERSARSAWLAFCMHCEGVVGPSFIEVSDCIHCVYRQSAVRANSIFDAK